jgi:tetratricopeptide (TPR) repeat protein
MALVLIWPSNTAQVLTSLAETICDGKNTTKESCDEALGFFQEALTHFNRCLDLQQLQMSEIDEQHSRMNDKMTISEADNAGLAERVEQRTSDERWAMILEPVTSSTLIDTVIAQLETLTALCSLLGSYGQSELQWINRYYDGNLRDKVMVCAGASERKHETLLAKARFTSALTDVAFRLGLIDVSTYESELKISFSPLDITEDPQALCDKADAEITLSTSIGIQLPFLLQSQDLTSLNGLRWKYLGLALDDLTAVAKLPDLQNIARVHLRRGDCEVLRYQLGQAPTHYDRAFRSASVLIMNAGTYYRGASGFSKGLIEDEREAIMKEAIIRSLSDDMDKLELILHGSEEVKSALAEVVAEMKEEGLLSSETAASIAELFPGNIT